MLVTQRKFIETIQRFTKTGQYGLDTETTGLKQSDSLFSVILTDESESFYFNFNPESQPGVRLNPEYVLPRAWLSHFHLAFDNPDSIWFIQNAKFDMRMLAKEGLEIRGTVHCTEAIARVIKNNQLKYNLATLGEAIGIPKSDAVEEYISDHKLWTEVQVPGKSTAVRLKHFDRVPFDLISIYGEQDGRVVRAVGVEQVARLAEMHADKTDAPSIWGVVHNERRLTKACFKMERRGIKIDRDYVTKALTYETRQVDESIDAFQAATGILFSDGPKCLTMAFDKLGEVYPRTEAGNPSFAKDVLENMKTPVAKMVTDIRRHSKFAGTYYANFLHLADSEDVIRADIRQGGTETGRFSYRDPNLQNVPKEDRPGDERKPFHVRQSFVPRPDHCFVMIDYNQQEFRMILDYAGEKRMIDAINAGADVHQATADEVGISRQEAKVFNFGLAYGMGVVLLASNLFDLTLPLPVLSIVWKKNNGRERLSDLEKEIYRSLDPQIVKADLQLILKAQGIKEQYFRRLPKVKRFFSEVMKKAAVRGFVWNWAGRRCHISDPEFAYIAPNHIIQGGGSDTIKFAMTEIDDMLATEKTRSAMLLQVHDELVFETHRDELDLVPRFQGIMESIYKPKSGMKLTCSVEHSWVSWGPGTKKKGAPNA